MFMELIMKRSTGWNRGFGCWAASQWLLGAAIAGGLDPVIPLVDLGEAPQAPRDAVVAPGTGQIRPLSVTGGFTVTTASREASRVFYSTVYAASEGIPEGWTGNILSGVPGTNSPQFDEAVLRRINYYRAMAGVPAAVTFDPDYARKTQQAALMMSANRQLSHTPPTTWIYYTAEGAEAAGKSNLALGYSGPAAIDGLIFDTGANNTAAGHRRWFLYPQTQKMGTGNVSSDQGYPSSDATWVIDSNYGLTRPATRDDFVAWPPAGFVPYSLVPARWTFSYPGSFIDATVTVTRDGVPVPVRVDSQGSGAGENSIVFITGDLDPNSGPATPFARPAVDSTNVIVVGPIRVGDGQQKTFTYSAVLFDPARPGPDAVAATLSGPDTVIAGQGSDFAFTPVPNADAYRWRQTGLAAYSKIEGAEDAVPAVEIVSTAGYSVIATGVAASGSRSFHLAHAKPERQQVTLAASLLVSATSELRFSAFVGVGSPAQTARVQITADGGGNWQDVWTRTGTNTASVTVPKVVFQPVSVSLAQFSGQVVQVRFLYDYLVPGALYYGQTANGFGFHFDDVAVTGAQQLQAEVTSLATATTLHFVPSTAGDYLLQVQPRFFGEFYGAYGPVKTVVATTQGLTVTSIAGGSGSTLTIEFTAPPGVTSGFLLERSDQPGGAWALAPGTATAGLNGRFRFTAIATTSAAGFFRIRTP
jgi:uncharacterized protein YkwD